MIAYIARFGKRKGAKGVFFINLGTYILKITFFRKRLTHSCLYRAVGIVARSLWLIILEPALKVCIKAGVGLYMSF